MSDDHMDAWLERDRRHKDSEARSERLIELLMKERDALRAKLDAATRERDFLVSEYERAVKCEPQGFTHAAAHVYNAIVNAKCDASAEHFMRLQGKLDETEAALCRISAWVNYRDRHVDTDWCYMTELQQLLTNNGLWREEPDA